MTGSVRLPSYTLQIGPLAVQIDSPDDLLPRAYPGFFVPVVAQPDLALTVRISGASQPPRWEGLKLSLEEDRLVYSAPGCRGRLSADGTAELEVFASHPFLETDLFMRLGLGFLALHRGGMLLHTAGVVERGRAYLFFGHSGSGKTTSARLSAPRQVLNDDLVLLLPDPASGPSAWLACATPFTNPSQVPPGPGQAPLAGLFRLLKDPQVFLQPMSPAEALAELLSCVPLLAVLPQELPRVIPILTRLIGQVEHAYLHFRKDPSFWQQIAPADAPDL